MEKLYCRENVEKLAETVIVAVQSNNVEHLDGLLNVLRILACGPPGERCQSFFGVAMPRDRYIAAVLSAKCVRRVFKSSQDACANMFRLLMAFPYLTVHLCRAVSVLLSCAQDEKLKEEMANGILAHPELHKFDLPTIEVSVSLSKTQLELLLLRITAEESPEMNDMIRHWALRSAQSATIFASIATILNEFLIELKCKTRVLNAISRFVADVATVCEKKSIDFVNLYPTELQSLVNLLSIDPETLGCFFDDIYRQLFLRFATLTQLNPRLALILSSHFPKWMKYFR